ncbi:MAG: aminopeptidase P family N-terminal domain-containing protein, partial [Candidatus Marinimicrobia bacterium]|nr:aminopeptidase P family N-terminal domain-containing protein [Candidatus Neomarinimicrobiota bacterium]
MQNTEQNIAKIRTWLKENNLEMLIIPHDDEYLSEYIPPENERLAWATGFTGSAGMAVITLNKAAIFVDGRYTVQVKQQVDEKLYSIQHISKTPWVKWIQENQPEGGKLGFDPRMHRVSWKKTIEKKLNGKHQLYPVAENPIDSFWIDRPSPVEDKAIMLAE